MLVSIAYQIGENVSPQTPMSNGTDPASCNGGPPAFCDGYAQGYPHGVEYALGREIGAKAADHDWQLLTATKNAKLIAQAQEKTPPCPSGHTTDWCDAEYADEWNILSDSDTDLWRDVRPLLGNGNSSVF